MTGRSVHFSSARMSWRTPAATYDTLDAEFHFTYEACPVPSDGWGRDDLAGEWGAVTFCNPPYGRALPVWVRKAWQQAQSGKTVVLLIPSRTDTAWWHEYVMRGEVRFIRGRLHFDDHANAAPFPSCIVIFRSPTSQEPPK